MESKICTQCDIEIISTIFTKDIQNVKIVISNEV